VFRSFEWSAYSVDDDGDSTPVYWLGVLAAVLCVHIIPFYFVTFQPTVPVAADESFTITLDDSFTLPVRHNRVARSARHSRIQARTRQTCRTETHARTARAGTARGGCARRCRRTAATKPQPNAPEPPAAPAPAPEKKEPEVIGKSPLRDREFTTSNPSPDTAFDESKETSKAAPKKRLRVRPKQHCGRSRAEEFDAGRSVHGER